jgi:hypothetical protein
MENKIITERPMEILEKLKNAIEPLGYEIVGFEVPIKDYITFKIAKPRTD